MNAPIRILQATVSNDKGGLTGYICQNYRFIDRQKIQFDFLTYEDDLDFRKEFEDMGARFYKVPHPTHFKEYLECLRNLQSMNGYKAVHFNMSYGNVLPLLAAKKAGFREIILHSHSTKIDDNRKLIRFLKTVLNIWDRPMVRRISTMRLACSKAAGRWMFGENESFTVINNAIETEKFLVDPAKRARIRSGMGVEGNFVIGHVARFSYQKNHLFLLDVFKKFHDKHPESVLWLIGGAAGNEHILNQVKEKVGNLCLAKAVQFLGVRNDVGELMQAMDCFVLPSRFEGLPVTGIEAQTAGLPCLFADTITREAKITDLVSFLPLDDAGAWFEKLEHVMHGKRKNMRQEIIEAGYDLQHEIGKLERFYMRISGINRNEMAFRGGRVP